MSRLIGLDVLETDTNHVAIVRNNEALGGGCAPHTTNTVPNPRGQGSPPSGEEPFGARFQEAQQQQQQQRAREESDRVRAKEATQRRLEQQEIDRRADQRAREQGREQGRELYNCIRTRGAC